MIKKYEIKAEEIIELARLNSRAGYDKAIEDFKEFIRKGQEREGHVNDNSNILKELLEKENKN